jgi:hypothetical protein
VPLLTTGVVHRRVRLDTETCDMPTVMVNALTHVASTPAMRHIVSTASTLFSSAKYDTTKNPLADELSPALF